MDNNNRSKFVMAFLLLIITILSLILLLQKFNINIEEKLGLKPPKPVTAEEFRKMLPALNTSAKTCAGLFLTRSVDSAYTRDFLNYMKRLERHQKTFKSIMAAGDCEGFSAEQFTETTVQFYIARLPFIKTVCETGFNAGHSALLWMLSNPRIKVYAFDIGMHNHSRKMAQRLMKDFPSRLTVTWGSSDKTLPVFAKNNPKVKCDLIIVDGGHSKEIALADFESFKVMASKRHILYFGDTPCVSVWCLGPNIVWNEKLKNRQAESFAACSTAFNHRGYSIGIYTSNSAIGNQQ